MRLYAREHALRVASMWLHNWSGQDPGFCFDPLKNRRVVLSHLDDCGFLYCGRVVQALTARLQSCDHKLK